MGKGHQILDYLAYSISQEGHPEQARNLTLLLSENYPQVQRYQENIRYYNDLPSVVHRFVYAVFDAIKTIIGQPHLLKWITMQLIPSLLLAVHHQATSINGFTKNYAVTKLSILQTFNHK